MKTIGRGIVLLMSLILIGVSVFASEVGAEVTPEQALKALQDGNARFTAGRSEHPHADSARLAETAEKGQAPIATILGCSDSRVPPEVLFDQGVGDIFIVRVAGNVADTDEIATIEYGVEHLHTPVLVVLGHTKCGAVTAVVKGGKAEGSLPLLVDNIVPPVAATKKSLPNASEADIVNMSIRANVWQSINDIFRRSRIVRTLVEEGKLKVFGAIYSIDNGKIEWFDEAKPSEAVYGKPHKAQTKSKSHKKH